MKFFRSALLFIATLAHVASQAADPRKPNVLLILADDLGVECLSAYGGTSHKTPHLDRLLTGRYPFQNGLNFVLPSKRQEERPGKRNRSPQGAARCLRWIGKLRH